MPIIMTEKKMRPRDARDFYPTPIGLIEAALEQVDTRVLDGHSRALKILDPGAGLGVWGFAARKRWPQSQVTGLEYYLTERPPFYGDWLIQDYTKSTLPDQSFDIVMGNPPYKFAEAFLRQALRQSRCYVLYLLRLGFLEGQSRMKDLWYNHPPTRVWVLGKRPSFTGNKKTDATAYAMYLWDKLDPHHYPFDWLDWDYYDPMDLWAPHVSHDEDRVADLDELRTYIWEQAYEYTGQHRPQEAAVR